MKNNSLKFALTKIPEPSRKALSETKESLEEFLSEVTDCENELAVVEREFIAAAEIAQRLEKTAAREADAAKELTVVQVQLPLLGASRDALRKEAARLFGAVRAAIYRARREPILDTIGDPLFNALKNAVADAMTPFFGERAHAAQITQVTMSVNRLTSYLRRPAPMIDSFSAAKTELKETIRQIENILDGKPVIDLDMRNAAQ
jgi:septal ring factor EnvC (AmiA/AmiB activator)